MRTVDRRHVRLPRRGVPGAHQKKGENRGMTSRARRTRTLRLSSTVSPVEALDCVDAQGATTQSKIQAALDFGVDLSLTRRNMFEKTPAERLDALERNAANLRFLRSAKQKSSSS